MEQIKRQEETVVIYDDFGIPSIMRRIPKMTNAQLFEGGSDKTNAAFIIGGEEYDEIYLPVYEGSLIDGRLYSLPYTKPATGITLEEAENACFSKGEGWHLMTAAEWGLVANISLRNNTLPRGNTHAGAYHADAKEKGRTFDGYRTLTGSGPRTWTHNHQPDGIHDLCGNVWEWIRGIRLTNGRIQIAPNNDAALPIDLAENGSAWVDLIEPASGKSLNISAGHGISITTGQVVKNWDGCPWRDVNFKAGITEQMKELALYAGEPDAWIFADSEEKERCAYRGGHWYYGPRAGVFGVSFTYPRSHSGTIIGGRPAYFKKNR